MTQSYNNTMIHNLLLLFTFLVSSIHAEVIDLYDHNFEHLTQASTGQTTGKWLVKFYAPWCGHCKRLEPVWDDLSSELAFAYPDESILISRVDCTKNPGLTKRFEIKGYPTIKYLADRTMYSYRGTRKLSDLVDFVVERYKKDAEPEDVPAPSSWFEDMMWKVRHMINTNSDIKTLIEDIEHISHFRKNAAILFIFMGISFGFWIG